MWVFTSTGFISAVQKYGDKNLTIRARDKKSLEALAITVDSKISKTPYADYPYRLVCSHQDFITWLTNEAQRINYDNFKSQVALERGRAFAHPLNTVWSAMHEVEDLDARTSGDNTDSRGNE